MNASLSLVGWLESRRLEKALTLRYKVKFLTYYPGGGRQPAA